MSSRTTMNLGVARTSSSASRDVVSFTWRPGTRLVSRAPATFARTFRSPGPRHSRQRDLAKPTQCSFLVTATKAVIIRNDFHMQPVSLLFRFSAFPVCHTAQQGPLESKDSENLSTQTPDDHEAVGEHDDTKGDVEHKPSSVGSVRCSVNRWTGRRRKQAERRRFGPVTEAEP